jgi:AcrR family transcriptional regulator
VADRPAGGPPRPQRADARRNRELVLAAAEELLATEGPSVPVDEVARRAGVGAGTVYRHFPTKEALVEAVIRQRIQRLTDEAGAPHDAEDPGAAFFGFFTRVVEEARIDRALIDALADAGVDAHAAVAESKRALGEAIGRLLRRAQRAGAVRRDVTQADIKALLIGCMLSERHDAASRRNLATIVCDGLRAGSRAGGHR